MKTNETEAFKDALHLSRLIPLGAKNQAKKDAVTRWKNAIVKALQHKSN